MYWYYIKGGSKTYNLKEEIKQLKPERKNFNKWWRYTKEFKSWYLEIPNGIYTKKFDTRIKDFCMKNQLELEILEFTKQLTKSINDFKNEEEFFSYIHNQNNKNIKR